MSENNNVRESNVFNLKDLSDRRKIKIDEDFWRDVSYIVFHSESLEIGFKKDLDHANKIHRFLHSWFFIEVSLQPFTEKKRQEIWEEQGCNFCFKDNNDEFLDWFYHQARERNLIESDFSFPRSK